MSVESLIREQAGRTAAMRSILPASPRIRKPVKRIKQSDIDDAVAAALSDVAQELRSHKNDLPRWRAAMDFAIAIVLKHKGSAP